MNSQSRRIRAAIAAAAVLLGLIAGAPASADATDLAARGSAFEDSIAASFDDDDFAPMRAVPPARDPWDNRFCGKSDFTWFHYTTTNPHWDTMDYVDHFDDFHDGHLHNWRNVTDGQIYNMRCPIDW